MTPQLALSGAFLGALVLGAVSDGRHRRVPNPLVLSMLALALLGGLSSASPAGGLLGTLAGAGVGLVLWLPFWLLGMLGAGDVKFFAAGAAWLGPALGWRAALLAALLGGAWSVAVLLRRSGVYQTLSLIVTQTLHTSAFAHNADVSSVSAEARTLPYAIPMALAIAGAVLAPEALFDVLRLQP